MIYGTTSSGEKMSIWQKDIFLEPEQAGVLFELLDRILRQVRITKRKRPIGKIFISDFQINLSHYNCFMAIYNDMMSEKNTIYEDGEFLSYSEREKEIEGKKELTLLLPQLELLKEIIRTFLDQNNGVSECKLDLTKVKIDFNDYENLHLIWEQLESI